MKICPKCGTEYPDTITLCPSDGIALEKTDDSLIGKTLAGKYRIDARLSEGGMGTVYRGTHVLMDKTVAIKVLRPSLAADEKIVARFSREARAASRIYHPHALSVTDFGEAEDGVVFLVMEYLSGKTLKAVIRQEGPMPLTRVVAIIRQVGGALDAAHSQGVVHRDLKSDNIMLLTTNGVDYAKVLDFGIAKIKEPEGGYDPGLTAPDLVIGTPQYMSPEQCSQSPDIDARSDIYSLGVIIYEMLVGHVPFTGDSPTQIMMKQLQEPAPSVLIERDDLPESIGLVVSRAMAKLPENRYQTAGELVEDLAIAASMEVGGVGATTKQSTGPAGGSGMLAAEAEDEDTIVQPRVQRRMPAAPVVIPVPGQPLPRSMNINPWKILIPSLAGLLVIFAVVYAFTKKTETTNTNQTQPALIADPNSQPVEPAQPPTGKSETGVPAGGQTNQSVNANSNTAASPEESSPDKNVNESTKGNTNQNANTSNANTNRTAPSLPTPSRQLNTNEQPASSPPGTKTASPKPTLPPPTVAPTTAPPENL